jgi:hypothetical protein
MGPHWQRHLLLWLLSPRVSHAEWLDRPLRQRLGEALASLVRTQL